MANFESEKEWKQRLKNILEIDFGHTVYEEVSYKNCVDRGRIDLLVLTATDWTHHEVFPVIGIECKLLEKEGMNWLISSEKQMTRYMNKNNLYKKNGSSFPCPDICLVATPESWHEGIVYKWGGRNHKTNQKADMCCWETMTFIFQRILLKENCSILLEKHFQSNLEGGPIRNYYLGK